MRAHSQASRCGLCRCVRHVACPSSFGFPDFLDVVKLAEQEEEMRDVPHHAVRYLRRCWPGEMADEEWGAAQEVAAE